MFQNVQVKTFFDTDLTDVDSIFKYCNWYPLVTDNSYMGIKATSKGSRLVGKANFVIVAHKSFPVNDYYHLRENMKGRWRDYIIFNDFNRNDIRALNVGGMVYGSDWIYLVKDPENTHFHNTSGAVKGDYVLVEGHADRPIGRNFDLLRQNLISIRNNPDYHPHITEKMNVDDSGSQKNEDSIQVVNVEERKCVSALYDPNMFLKTTNSLLVPKSRNLSYSSFEKIEKINDEMLQ